MSVIIERAQFRLAIAALDCTYPVGSPMCFELRSFYRIE